MALEVIGTLVGLVYLWLEYTDSHIAFFAFLFLGDGLEHCLLYNVMNLHP